MNEPLHDLLITGARIYTADPRRPWAAALLTRGERILHVGSEAEARAQAGPQVERMHLPGMLVMPGLNDSHIHTYWGGVSLRMLDLEGVFTVEDLQWRLRDYAAANPDHQWLECTGLGYEALLPLAEPRLAIDAAVADRPVYIRAMDWHAAWVNSAALERAGIQGGAEVPRPNEVAMHEGRASGLLKERLATNLVSDLIPALTPAQQEAALLDAMRHLNELGITSVQNMNGDVEELARYQRLEAAGRQTIRALHYLRISEHTPRAYLRECAAIVEALRGAWNRANGIKLFIDGVVESKTAMLLSPYRDGSGDLGVPDLDLDAYREIVIAADALQMQVATHAIGDRAVRTVLDAYEAAAQANGLGRALRHRVEHIEVLDFDDLPRFAALGVTASMQPLHCAPTSDPNTTAYTQLLGPERLPGAFAWRSILESGALLSFGSDWPVVTADVFRGLHVAATRTNAAGQPAEGYQPQQRLTLAQAIDAYTRGAARAEHREDQKGQLKPGMLADIAVFTRDLFSHGPDAILGTEVALTVVGGQVVYRR